MTGKRDIVEQSNRAFDFVQKLYLEVSYMVKEIEGMLLEEDEKFILGRPSGYGVSTKGSTGLEPVNISLWLLRKFAVFFVPGERTEVKGGSTITKIDQKLRVLYLRIVLDEKDLDEPAIYSGVLHDISVKPEVKRFPKFESLMGYFQSSDRKLFKNPKRINYEDESVKVRGELIANGR